MSKVIKAKVRKVKGDGRTRFQYPSNWDAKAINVLVYQDDGLAEEYCIATVADKDLERFTSDPDIEEISEVEANALGSIWALRATRIIDEQSVIETVAWLLESPFAAGRLTTKQQEILDPENIRPGINKTPEFDIKNYL